jgi:hypothetical protein
MAGRKKLKLDARKSIFISEILTGKNGAEAARAAGVEKKNAARQANRWQKEPEVAAEIEKGLAAIREGAAVDVQTMIRQLDADRQFAIKTENASAATRASELKAKLCGLMIDRRDTRSAHIVQSEDFSNRDVALALAALCSDSDLVVTRNSDGPDGNKVTALDGASGADSWDASPGDGVHDKGHANEGKSTENSEEIGDQIPQVHNAARNKDLSTFKDDGEQPQNGECPWLGEGKRPQ